MQENASETTWTSQAALRVLDESPAQTALVDRQGTILFVNAAWSQFAAQNGGDPDRVGVGQNYLAACRGGGQTAQDAFTALDDVLRRRAPTRNLEYPCHSPTEKRWFRLRCVRIDAPPVAAAVIHDDLTDHYLANEARRRLEREASKVMELERDEARTTQALNTISHTLRTPLTPVRLQLATLSRKELSGEAASIVAKMRASAERLVEAVNEAVRAIELQQAPLKVEKLASAVAASRLHEALESSQALQNVAWHAKAEGSVLLDLGLLAPSIAELLRSSKARDPEGHAEIALDFDGWATVTVRHHGRAGAADANDVDDAGLDLALYMCRAAARMHGGTFTVDGGDGAVVYALRLPPA